MSMNNNPIGVFDSGVGGMTVYRALRAHLPQERFIYLGDTARLPYGTKSADTVARYAEQIARRLSAEGIKLLVVACNTASAQALPRLAATIPTLPSLGVVEPGAKTAVESSASGRIVVLATEGTVRSGVYQETIRRFRPEARVQALPCNMMVSLAEEGWTDGPEAEAVLRRYIAQINLTGYDTVVLGCTHFPLLAGPLKRLLPPHVTVIDSAASVAQAVQDYLADSGLLAGAPRSGEDRFLVTDGAERFRFMASRFLDGQAIETVEVVNL